MLTYEQTKALYDAGFPQRGVNNLYMRPNGTIFIGTPETVRSGYYIPCLRDLIEACGDDFEGTWRRVSPDKKTLHWMANGFTGGLHFANTPEEAVTDLYLAINKKE